MSALLFCCFTVLLFYYFTPDTVLPRPMFGVGRPRCEKKFDALPRTTTYYHVLQQNVFFASRTANLACRPSYSTVLLFYYFTISLRIQYCRGRCLGLAARDAKKFSTYYTTYYHVRVLPRTTAERSFCISDGQPCMSALLFSCFTVSPLSLQIQYCRGRCLGLAARDAKKFSKYYHVLQQNVAFASRTANLSCRPSYSTVLLFHSRYSTAAADVWGWPPEMQKSFPLTATRLAVRDAKTSAADVCGWLSEMQKKSCYFKHWI